MFDSIEPFRDRNGANWLPTQLNIPTFLCPSVKHVEYISGKKGHLQPATYAGVSGACRPGNFVDLEDTHCGDYCTDGMFFPLSGVRMAEVSDGTSHTLAIGERLYVLLPWMHGAWWVTRPDVKMCVNPAKNIRVPINADPNFYGYYKYDRDAPADAEKDLALNDLMFGSFHQGGSHFTFVDGSVHFIHQSLDLAVYQDLATRNGDEVVRWKP
jgi:prepilin-type processing-associated H-X9-DG protein